ncbi:probable leucine-rich repeat receptor-like protein kinase At1g35710 [Coffea eugenioides]|uniref:probable leucine-rich repeat receptor-like protein kinase At1g35710 n=1 Tax=Coffea eugenioides TaxID=49369 RepID=UPI000F609A7B|nr:probable leucine-rich repeat receptor-like protein kinase At1g35710 [Coffea eugenioides]
MSIQNYSIRPITLVFVCLVILHLLSSSGVNAASNQMHAPSSIGSEGKALLTWKACPDNYSQSKLSSWSSANPCSTWDVRCNKAGRVSVINITSFGIKGSNKLYGWIPEEIGKLKSLTILSLVDNMFTEIGNLTKLNELDLFGNQLSGLIPKEIGKLGSLTQLSLAKNMLTGPIPLFFGNLSGLTLLYLFQNYLPRPIPKKIGNLRKLNELEISGNQLSSPIPEEIGKLRSLTILSLANNTLTGQIPLSIGNLSGLTLLHLFQN